MKSAVKLAIYHEMDRTSQKLHGIEYRLENNSDRNSQGYKTDKMLYETYKERLKQLREALKEANNG